MWGWSGRKGAEEKGAGAAWKSGDHLSGDVNVHLTRTNGTLPCPSPTERGFLESFHVPYTMINHIPSI